MRRKNQTGCACDRNTKATENCCNSAQNHRRMWAAWHTDGAVYAMDDAISKSCTHNIHSFIHSIFLLFVYDGEQQYIDSDGHDDVEYIQPSL